MVARLTLVRLPVDGAVKRSGTEDRKTPPDYKSNLSLPLLAKAAQQRSAAAVPEALDIIKAGISQPFQLLIQRGSHAIEVEEATTRLDERKDLAINGSDDIVRANIVDRYRAYYGLKGTVDFFTPARLAQIRKRIINSLL